MTENKRFELIPYADITYGLFDWVKKEYIAEHLPIRFEGICDILNELHEENIKIKKNCNRTHKENAELIDCVSDLGYSVIIRDGKVVLER